MKIDIKFQNKVIARKHRRGPGNDQNQAVIIHKSFVSVMKYLDLSPLDFQRPKPEKYFRISMRIVQLVVVGELEAHKAT